MTNLICQDVAVVPFLWILPLGLYLISYIIAFDKDAWYDRRVWVTLLIVSLLPLLHLMFNQYSATYTSLRYQLLVACSFLLASCMVCHGELARRRSAAPQLTTFYLYVALGGALGGIFVNLVAPMVFTDFWELNIAIAATFVLLGVCIFLDRNTFRNAAPRMFFNVAWSLTTAALVVALVIQSTVDRDDVIHSARSFFGVMVIDETDVGDDEYHERALYHGRIRHGRQLYSGERKSWPTAYFGPDSGVAHAILQHPRKHAPNPADRGLNMGIVGLGVGTLAAYGTDQDTIRFYEIDPQVDLIAKHYFTYLSNSSARIETTLGDARISLEREFAEHGSNQFDILVIDAFSGDSIPVHLLTQEAFDLYKQHLRSDGILVVQITNRYVDISDIVRNAAAAIGMHAVLMSEYPDPWYLSSNHWILMGNSPLMYSEETKDRQSDWPTEVPRPIRWTDDFSNLFEVLDWN
jgi:predicted membrane-bound spermidine synthase